MVDLNQMLTGNGVVDMDTRWREVSPKEFFDTIGQLNVHPQIQPGRYPYISLWQTPMGHVKGRSVSQEFGPTRFYVPEQ